MTTKWKNIWIFCFKSIFKNKKKYNNWFENFVLETNLKIQKQKYVRKRWEERGWRERVERNNREDTGEGGREGENEREERGDKREREGRKKIRERAHHTVIKLSLIKTGNKKWEHL